VNSSFTIENIGETGSNLEWEIAEYPEWGNWTFYPNSGVGLTPEVGLLKVNVTVIAPENETMIFTGNLKVINKHNNSDYCYIPVYLETPKNKIKSLNLKGLFLEHFPLLERLLGLIK
jgi:hypothetical protein